MKYNIVSLHIKINKTDCIDINSNTYLHNKENSSENGQNKSKPEQW